MAVSGWLGEMWSSSYLGISYRLLGFEERDQQSELRRDRITHCFLLCVEAHLGIVRYLGHSPGAYFRTCKECYKVKKIFMQTHQKYVWERMIREFWHVDEASAVKQYLEQSGLPALEDVSVTRVQANWGTEAILEHMTRFPKCEQLTICQADALSPDDIAQLAQKCASLKRVIIEFCGSDEETSGTKKPLLSKVASHFPQLEELVLFLFDPHADVGLTALAELCPKLHTVHLLECDKNIDESLRQLISIREGIRSIAISPLAHGDGRVTGGISNAGIQAIAAHCPGLVEIDIVASLDGAVTTEGIIALVQRCTSLRKIRLACWALSDNTLSAIAKHCPALEEVCLSWSRGMSAGGIEKFVGACSSLISIAVTGHQEITDSVLSSIAESCRKLKTVHVESCKNITDSGMVVLARHCTSLVSLRCGGNATISDATLYAIAESCPYLEELHISGCILVSDAGIKAVAEKCHHLRKFTIANIPRITEDGIVTVLRLRPHCDLTPRLFA